MAGLGDMADSYPGTSYVDWLGLDGYCWPVDSGNPAGLTFAEVFGASYARITSMGPQPLIVCETGATETATNKPAWIQDMAATAGYLFPRLRALCWFSNQTGSNDWRIDSTATSLAAFRQVSRQPPLGGTIVL